MISTSVKWIRHDMRGAPEIRGNAPGALIAALKALLVTGWGSTTALSVTVAAGIATATFNAGSSFTEHAVVLVEGAAPAALNGEARVLTASNTQITFATTAPDGLATGTITVKNAPAGWEEVFWATNKSVFRSTDVTGARFSLWVDDSNGMYARVRGFEAMTDVATGSGPFPTDVLLSGGGYWHKSMAANSTPIPYLLAADPKQVLQAISYGVASISSYNSTTVYGFGEGVHFNPAGDPFATVLSAAGSLNNSLGVGGLSGASANSSSSGGAFFARAWQGLGGAVYARPIPESGATTTLSGGDSTMGAAPSLVDGSVKMARMLLKEQGAPGVLRSCTPGCFYVPQVLDSSLYQVLFALHEGGGELQGRRLAAVFVGNGVASRGGTAFIDITGPWRGAEGVA